jgi:hypothetical protein
MAPMGILLPSITVYQISKLLPLAPVGYRNIKSCLLSSYFPSAPIFASNDDYRRFFLHFNDFLECLLIGEDQNLNDGQWGWIRADIDKILKMMLVVI